MLFILSSIYLLHRNSSEFLFRTGASMSLIIRGLCPVVVILCLNFLAKADFDQQGHYTNDFAVEIDGDSNVADLVASTHGFSVVRHVSVTFL